MRPRPTHPVPGRPNRASISITSPYRWILRKVRQGLDELQWQSHVILLSAQQQFSPSYVRLNSRCVVPTLVLNGKVTTDTNNILHTLADQIGQTGTFRFLRKNVRSWLTGLNGQRNYLLRP